MNRFQHDNIDPGVTAKRRESALKGFGGINRDMSRLRRDAKQKRHKENAEARRYASLPATQRK